MIKILILIFVMIILTVPTIAIEFDSAGESFIVIKRWDEVNYIFGNDLQTELAITFSIEKSVMNSYGQIDLIFDPTSDVNFGDRSIKIEDLEIKLCHEGDYGSVQIPESIKVSCKNKTELVHTYDREKPGLNRTIDNNFDFEKNIIFKAKYRIPNFLGDGNIDKTIILETICANSCVSDENMHKWVLLPEGTILRSFPADTIIDRFGNMTILEFKEFEHGTGPGANTFNQKIVQYSDLNEDKKEKGKWAFFGAVLGWILTSLFRFCSGYPFKRGTQ